MDNFHRFIIFIMPRSFLYVNYLCRSYIRVFVMKTIYLGFLDFKRYYSEFRICSFLVPTNFTVCHMISNVHCTIARWQIKLSRNKEDKKMDATTNPITTSMATHRPYNHTWGGAMVEQVRQGKGMQ